MIPVGGRPVIYWTLRYLRSLGLRKFVIAVAERGLYVERYVDYLIDGDCEVQFIKPSRDGGLGGTVSELAQAVTTRSALVVLGDTFFRFQDAAVLSADEPVVLTHPVDEAFRWCTADVDSHGYVSALHDKEPNFGGASAALIGVYFAPQAKALRQAATAAVSMSPGRTELSQILLNLNRVEQIRAVPAATWQDCGNPDLQTASHQKLLESRAFNHLHVDPLFGIIRKQSERGEKLIDEINYLRLLPAELSALFPRLIDYSIAADAPWMRMEYFGFPTLAEVFLYERPSGNTWSQIFGRLLEIQCDCFMKWTRNVEPESLRSMYLGKTQQRLATLQGPPELLKLVRHAGPIQVNGRVLSNLPNLWKSIEQRIAIITRNGHGSIIHGDFCLSNILYDWRSRTCKLIDPRGSFGSNGIYGDPRYDVAKLYHSVYGLYDFIVQDLFRLDTSSDDIRLEIGSGKHHEDARLRFESIYFPTFDRDEILLLTALLFISMPPLHYDHPRRQIAMYLRGLQLLNELFTK